VDKLFVYGSPQDLETPFLGLGAPRILERNMHYRVGAVFVPISHEYIPGPPVRAKERIDFEDVGNTGHNILLPV